LCKNNSAVFYIRCIVITLFLSNFALSSDETKKEIILKGHVWAVIENWLPHTGMSDRFQIFVFGVESKDQEGNKIASPVLVNYLIPRSDDILPELLFHYSNVIELHVNHLPHDLPLESVALIKYMTADNKEAHPPDIIMRLLDGAPTNILKMDMVLPYYDVLPDGYRCIGTIDDSPTANNGSNSIIKDHGSASTTYLEMRKWLFQEGDDSTSDKSLQWLFRHGDERLEDLIHALQDDFRVSFAAERIIRYLGNPKGMAELIDWYRKRTNIEGYGNIIPIPLSEWDYDRIEGFINKPADRWGFWGDGLGYVSDYIYPLALDDSLKAQVYLQDIIRKTSGLKRDGSSVLEYIDQVKESNPRKLLPDGKDLGKIVQENAFFLGHRPKGRVTTHVLTKTINDDKALIEIEQYWGALASATYHIVLKRERHGWRYISVTLVEIS
jgi:hypothetical protein